MTACRSPQLNKKGDTAPDNDTANKLLHGSHQPDRHHVGHGRARSNSSTGAQHNLLREIKKVGPDLKEVRMKIHKEWIPYWLEATRTISVRPRRCRSSACRTTKFRRSPRTSGRSAITGSGASQANAGKRRERQSSV